MVKLIQLNIEGSRHLARVVPFLENEKPDIVCLQELNEKDIPHILDALGETAVYVFTPMVRRMVEGSILAQGSGVFSLLPFRDTLARHYTDIHGLDHIYDHSDIHQNHKTQTCAVTGADIETDDGFIRILTTHFTWSVGGEADEYQRKDVQELLSVLSPLGDFVLTGDFNAPRGREIFTTIAERYEDNVPAKYTTSIDGALHRAGDLPYMVDGIFSTSAYEVTDVEMICGVSDHCALIAHITKKS